MFLRFKVIEGFNLLQFMRGELTKERVQQFYKMIRDDFDQNASDGGKLFKQDRFHIGEERIYDLEQIDKALKAFEESEGKINILINCEANL